MVTRLCMRFLTCHKAKHDRHTQETFEMGYLFECIVSLFTAFLPHSSASQKGGGRLDGSRSRSISEPYR